jgi:pSer/pThr/pTyr-binding forkhead associated (FHA) protein
MQELEITWPGGTARFGVADSPIQIGRSSEAAIPLTASSVSRQHLSLVWTGSTWTASDRSTHGTFDPIGVKLAPEWNLPPATTIRLGGPEGVEVHIEALGDNGGPRPGGGLLTDALADPVPASSPSVLDPGVETELPRRSGLANDGAANPATESGGGTGGVLEKFFDKADRSAPTPEQSDPLFPDAKPDPSLRHVGGGVPSPPIPKPDSGLTPGSSSNTGFSPGSNPDAPSILSDVPSAAPSPVNGDAVAAPAGANQSQSPNPAPMDFAAGEPPVNADAGETGAQGAVAIGPNSTIISDSTLRLSVAGQDYSFLPGAVVTIGRDPSCLVQLDERHSLVSRHHLRITFDNDSWWLEDQSSKGTFVDGRRIKKPYKAVGAFVANLGSEDAGTPLRVITAGEHRQPRNRAALLVAATLVAALGLLGFVAFQLTQDEPVAGEPDFESAKLSTVMLFGLQGGQGSGFFVSDDLILTNQHVADLSPQMLVGVTREPDQPAQIEYATELVANHPFLDISVLRISNKVSSGPDGQTISSEPVGEIGIEPVSIGDSADVTIGDRVFNTGFPGRLSITSETEAGDLRLPAVVATSGEAANFSIWPGCSNPDSSLFIPEDSPDGVTCSPSGDLDDGVLLASFFSSGQGSSGSAVFHENAVVAVVYAGAADENNATLAITTAVFDEWLDEIIDQNP